MAPTDEFGAELRRRRTEREISLRDLAARVHCDPGFLSRVERGLRRPSPMIARLCDRELCADGALVSLIRGEGPARTLAVEPMPPVSFLVRAFDRASAGATVLTSDLDGTVAGAYALFTAIRAQGHRTTPSALLPALAVQFGTLRAAAAQAHGLTREQLVFLAAHYAEYAGWMMQECGDRAGALTLNALAARLSEQAPDRSLTAYLQLRRADIALYSGDGAAVVEVAERVERAAACPSVRAVAAQRAAQGWAVLGRAAPCAAALDRAAEATAAADSAPTPAPYEIKLGSAGGGRLMDVVRGWCLLDLGRPDGAVEALRSGLGRAPRTARRARALYGVRLALAHAVAGDTRQARETGTAALADARHVDSASVRHQLQALATVVRRWSDRGGIRDFRMLIDCSLTPSRIHS